MAVQLKRKDELVIRSDKDVVLARQAVRELAVELAFNLIDQTKLVTAASELARNMVDFAGGGIMHREVLEDGTHEGIRLIFEDRGPGIPDMELAMKNGYSTGAGFGLGLGGARRLTDQFEIVSVEGEGTRVSITKWRGFTRSQFR